MLFTILTDLLQLTAKYPPTRADQLPAAFHPDQIIIPPPIVHFGVAKQPFVPVYITAKAYITQSLKPFAVESLSEMLQIDTTRT
uniref:Uncharacterized protein n=1 Tax=Onchocerca volvulus TaxID=6282 RepID=A0A8R1TY91_ONCVO